MMKMLIATRHYRPQNRFHQSIASKIQEYFPPSPSLQSTQCRRRNYYYYRGIVNSSIAPPLEQHISHTSNNGRTKSPVFTERPEIIVLAESSLYHHDGPHRNSNQDAHQDANNDNLQPEISSNSWHNSFASFYPSRGLHFASIDITASGNNENTTSHGKNELSLSILEQNLKQDLSNLNNDNGPSSSFGPNPTSSSAHAVVIARGPIPSLAAQYFLESLPLAGLVLVDPLLLPEDGRLNPQKIMGQQHADRWHSSVMDLLSMLEGKSPAMYDNDARQSIMEKEKDIPHPLSCQNHENAKSEMNLLYSFANRNNNVNDGSNSDTNVGALSRPLQLEPGAVPILILYSGQHCYQEYYRICAERTASFHTCGGSGDYFDQVSVLKIPKMKVGGAGSGGIEELKVDDVDWVAERIYEWYDDVVA